MVLQSIVQTNASSANPATFTLRTNSWPTLRRWRLMYYKVVTSGTFPSNTVQLIFDVDSRDDEEKMIVDGSRLAGTSLPVVSGATEASDWIPEPVWRSVRSTGHIDQIEIELRNPLTGSLLTNLTHMEIILDVDYGQQTSYNNKYNLALT